MTRMFFIVLCLAALVAACGRTETASELPAPLVKAYTVEARSGGALELRGSVAAASRIRLGFKQAGVVAEVLVREGDRVTKGQEVARLDDVDARSLVRIAVASRDKAKRDSDRATRLAAEGAVASGLRDDAVSQLEAAEAQLIQARDALERTRLLSPTQGTVFMRTAEPGETVGAGAPIVVLDGTDALVVKAGATERELQTLRVGQSAALIPEAGGASLAGRVVSIATTPNPADGLYVVEVAPESGRQLRPGVLLRMRFAGAPAKTMLSIPLLALVRRQDRDFVFVLENGPRVKQRPIEVEQAEGHEITLRAGLASGERIVAEGAYFLQDGQTVRIMD